MRQIPIGTFDCHTEDIEAVSRVLKDGMLSVGPEMREFEQQVAKYHGLICGVMVNSGQSALEVAIEASKHALGKEKLRIVCPALTYAATLWAIIRTGCTPVFCDVDHTYNLDWNKVDELDTDVVMSVDLCGKSAAPATWEGRAGRFIIEDACEAFGNKKVGYGDLVCFSFYVSHIITTGSGGMICYDDDSAEEWLRSFISHGRTLGGDFTKFTDGWIDRFKFDKVGVSSRSNNMAAALGLSQLTRIDAVVAQRKANAKVLLDVHAQEQVLQDNFTFPDDEYHNDSAYQFFPILIKNPDIDRTKLLQHLYSHGIDSRVMLSLTNQPIFHELFGDIEAEYPVAENCNDRGFIVGCHQNLTGGDMEYIAVMLKGFIS